MTAVKGRVIAWDVINELMYEKEFFPYLPKDIAVDWFKLAKQLDPQATLFMNEYSMLNSIASPANIKNYLSLYNELKLKGAPIEGLGIQGHVGRQPRNPAQVITDLDLFKPVGLPVQITEFDINMTDEELQADYTRDFLIACYSHPVVTGKMPIGNQMQPCLEKTGLKNQTQQFGENGLLKNGKRIWLNIQEKTVK
jgi:endo-1,4-beta-xylanase